LASGGGLFDLPVLERLRPGLDAFEVGVRAVGPCWRVRLLRRGFLPARLFLVAAFLPLPFSLAFLL
jgi:hypothetical protein